MGTSGASRQPKHSKVLALLNFSRPCLALPNTLPLFSGIVACAKDLAGCRRGSTAVEFALLATVLISTILFIMLVAVVLYFNQALDYATSKASRQIMVGAVQKSNVSQASFQSLVCSFLPRAFNCSNVIVNVQTATEAAQPGGYYSYVTANQSGLIIPALSNSSAQFSPGTAGSYEYVQVIYPITFIPSLISQFLGGATYQGSAAYLVVSTVAFRNEQYQ
ncbi:MAG: pilus assembly protein [Beijerinckiaceae bacterium]|nr:pilus assembly protein [Beijerinckiaceae bacterium]